MIKVIEEKPAPRGIITCSNCGSKLEYGNADLYEDYTKSNITSVTSLNEHFGKTYYLACPICGCKQYASWIMK